MSDGIDITDLDLTGRIARDKCIGHGGFSDVYHGTLLKDGSNIEVAIKFLTVQGFSHAHTGDRIMKRFYREVLLWRMLQHPNVVPLLGYTQLSDMPPGLVSPLYANGNAIEYLDGNPQADRRTLALGIIDGLAYLHSIPMVHGDLKGQNVLVDSRGHACLSDFGMSRFIDEASHISGHATSSVGGTLRFMCPELLNENPRTIATDMWAAGCLILQVFTSTMPYRHLIAQNAVVYAILRGEPPSTDGGDIIAPPLWDCMKMCWSREPGDRPSASQLGLHLTSWEGNKTPVEEHDIPTHFPELKPTPTYEIKFNDMNLAGRVTVSKVITCGGLSDLSKGTLLVDSNPTTVAIKYLGIRGHNCTEEAKKRLLEDFYRVARSWRNLDHLNVVRFLGYTFLPDEPPGLISPWYDNGNVIDHLRASHTEPDRRALALGVLNGLEYLHSIPVVHGQLKGENVLVAADGRACLCNFGMSQLIDKAGGIAGFTITTVVIDGTIRFMCPELFLDKSKTTATDMWAVGCLIVQILTDHIPYKHLTQGASVITAIMRGDPPSSNRDNKIDEALWSCILKCWRGPPGDRPKVSEFKTHLEPQKDHGTYKDATRPASSPPIPPPRSSTPQRSIFQRMKNKLQGS